MKRRSVAAKRSSLRFRFINDTIAELKKVTWPQWPDEILRLTALVLMVAVTVGLILGLIDYGFTRLVNDLLLGG
jgi:preprotein translocase subunit SecE